MGSIAFEKHYRIRELAGLWGLSAKTVTRIFADEAGVIRVANDGTCKRKYATLEIPESVAHGFTRNSGTNCSTNRCPPETAHFAQYASVTSTPEGLRNREVSSS